MTASTSLPAVLVVEDEPLIQEIIEATLEEGGFAVRLAISSTAALTALADDVSDLVALITDIDLGKGPDGWEVARQARRLNPDLAVVYMSGGSVGGWTAEGVPNSTMVPKPFAPATLLVALASRLNKSDTNG